MFRARAGKYREIKSGDQEPLDDRLRGRRLEPESEDSVSSITTRVLFLPFVGEEGTSRSGVGLAANISEAETDLRSGEGLETVLGRRVGLPLVTALEFELEDEEEA